MSDSEEVDDHEEDKEGRDEIETPPIYSTPHIPNTGVVFWGSPEVPESKFGFSHYGNSTSTKEKPRFKTPSVRFNWDSIFKPTVRSGRKSLTSRKNPFCSTPLERVPPMIGSLTTPSSSKNFPRFKSTIVLELFDSFNKSVFKNKVIFIFLIFFLFCF